MPKRKSRRGSKLVILKVHRVAVKITLCTRAYIREKNYTSIYNNIYIRYIDVHTYIYIYTCIDIHKHILYIYRCIYIDVYT